MAEGLLLDEPKRPHGSRQFYGPISLEGVMAAGDGHRGSPRMTSGERLDRIVAHDIGFLAAHQQYRAGEASKRLGQCFESEISRREVPRVPSPCPRAVC